MYVHMHKLTESIDNAYSYDQTIIVFCTYYIDSSVLSSACGNIIV